MIAGLEEWLHGIEPSGAPELADALGARLAGAPAPLRLESGAALGRSQAHRIRFATETGSHHRSLVIKRLPLDRAQREQRALRRWLPAVGLATHGAPLLEIVGARGGAAIWHVYEDLGDETLAYHVSAAPEPRRERIRAAVELAAGLHRRFAGHPLLAECRLYGLDLGARFFAESLGDAARALAALQRSDPLPLPQQALLERLLGRIVRFTAEGEVRMRDFAALGWPETLLHGDLWLANFMWASGAAAGRVRLIDWDRSGIGAALYDLSTLLRQLPAPERAFALDVYREAVRAAGWPWPEAALFERVAETCELARSASCLLWRTLFALEQPLGHPLPDWWWNDLLEMEGWFTRPTPLLSGRDAASAA